MQDFWAGVPTYVEGRRTSDHAEPSGRGMGTKALAQEGGHQMHGHDVQDRSPMHHHLRVGCTPSQMNSARFY